MPELTSLRDSYGNTLIELGKVNPNIIVLDADLSFSTRTHFFKEIFPDRFFDFGISEADMIGTAAGLASCGKIVFASTFAIFATGRAWDQVRLGICYQKLNVKIVATHGGISTGADGYSHQAIEDITLMRVLPNMRVVVPCDAVQTKEVIQTIVKEEGPFYVRLVKPKLPVIYKKCNFKLGKATTLEEGKDITIGAIGPMVANALEACKILKSKGIQARIIDFASVKPIDKEAIRKACAETRGIITCEDHMVTGGLGDAVAEVILTEHPVPHLRIGIQNIVSESGSYQDLYEKYGLTAHHIAQKAMGLLNT
ncbi:transketolase family protein [candidate division WOR-3 bacterium]|nr:transketolase family protein [candidate division WOR-3 bacterium]